MHLKLLLETANQAFTVSSVPHWERGRLARIFLKNASRKPALPAKNEEAEADYIIKSYFNTKLCKIATFF